MIICRFNCISRKLLIQKLNATKPQKRMSQPYMIRILRLIQKNPMLLKQKAKNLSLKVRKMKMIIMMIMISQSSM